MPSNTIQKAVIYLRVASFEPPQSNVKSDTVLATKESRCREFIKSKGYDLDTIFYDIGVSGNQPDRAGFKDMVNYLNTHKKEGRIVIVDDINNLARNALVYFELRSAIEVANAKLESPVFEVDDCAMTLH